MPFSDRRFWLALNVTLGVVVLSLAGWFLLHAAPPDGAEAAAPADASETPARRVVAAGGSGVRPVFYGEPSVPARARAAWLSSGVPPPEWNVLPATPGIDMSDTPQHYQVRFSLPGVRGERDVNVTVTGRLVTVRALLFDAAGVPAGSLLQRVQLPPAAGSHPDAAIVFLSNGVLHVAIAR